MPSNSTSFTGFFYEPEPWGRVFVGNLIDLVRRRDPLPLELTSPPADFWPDVFVSASFPRRSLLQSVLCHVIFIAALYNLSNLSWTRPAQAINPFARQTITYYDVSEYLPALNSASAPAKVARKGEPVYAKQDIISLPPEPDNSTQTIVAPSKLKLRQDVALPNLMIWTPLPAPVPVAASSRPTSQLVAPVLPIAVVAPPPKQALRNLAELRAASLPQPDVVQPPPDTKQLDQSRSLNLPAPSVIEPPPTTQAVQTKLGDINIGHWEVQVSAPRLPVAEQQVSAVVLGQAGATGRPVVGPAGALAAPSTQGLGSTQAAGQLVALGIHPVAPNGPIAVPPGSRSGVFAAGTEGKSGATGTPDIKGGGTAAGAGGSGTGHDGPGGAAAGNPAGIFVGTGSGKAASVAALPQTPASPASSLAGSRRLVASLTSPHLPGVARSTAPGSFVSNPTGKIEDAVFGPKKYYSMMLNMPNLTSAGGSWIVRFAELRETSDKTAVTAPIATLKVDPGYPAELIRARVEGTVTLYAVIRSDGSVGEVRVLRGVDDRLDQKARLALSRWHFRPGTKNGNAVDLEAVVQIPFLAHKIPF